jgi:hypothetical protein
MQGHDGQVPRSNAEDRAGDEWGQACLGGFEVLAPDADGESGVGRVLAPGRVVHDERAGPDSATRFQA